MFNNFNLRPSWVSTMSAAARAASVDPCIERVRKTKGRRRKRGGKKGGMKITKEKDIKKGGGRS